MKISHATAICIIIGAFGVVLASDHSDPRLKTTVSRNLSSMPLAFTENQGQWPDSILFRTNAGGATMWFTKNGVYYQFTRAPSSIEAAHEDIRHALYGTRSHRFGELSLLSINNCDYSTGISWQTDGNCPNTGFFNAPLERGARRAGCVSWAADTHIFYP
ncbi:MAG: hypothetical protein ACE5K8_01430 [Candidatus Zixiibacteriota bacterium]